MAPLRAMVLAFRRQAVPQHNPPGFRRGDGRRPVHAARAAARRADATARPAFTAAAGTAAARLVQPHLVVVAVQADELQVPAAAPCRPRMLTVICPRLLPADDLARLAVEQVLRHVGGQADLDPKDRSRVEATWIMRRISSAIVLAS